MDNHHNRCSCKVCHDKRVANGTIDAYIKMLRADADATRSTTVTRMPLPSKTAIDDLLKAGAKADSQIAEATRMPGGNTDDGFIKNLFKTVQGVNHDSLCPHGLPYYACMSCSH